jgi:hypothetical protein
MRDHILGTLIIVVFFLVIDNAKHRGAIISMRQDNATQAQRITDLEERFDNYPFDHSKFETDINLIGSSLFTNWEMASERYSKRGK